MSLKTDLRLLVREPVLLEDLAPVLLRSALMRRDGRLSRASPKGRRPAPPAAQPLADTRLAPTPPSPAEPGHDQIRERAYMIFLNRCGGPGDALGDWLRAERELRDEHRRRRR